MSQNDLIQLILNQFEEGKTQEDVRQIVQKHSVTEEQYASALRSVLSMRLVEGEAESKMFTLSPTVLIILAIILIITGRVLAMLHGEIAVVAGWGLVALGAASAAGAWYVKRQQSQR